MKIPDDVFENRCRYCMHGNPNAGNQDIPAEWLFSSSHRKDRSCKIFGIARCNDIPGECRSFAPNAIYGICATCEYNNIFLEGFCWQNEHPNKRQVYIGNSFYASSSRPYYWKEHELSTCDAYKPHHDRINTMKKQASEGIIPRNFDPDTMEPLEDMYKNETAEKWAEIDRKRIEEEATKKIEKTFFSVSEDVEQISLFDVKGD